MSKQKTSASKGSTPPSDSAERWLTREQAAAKLGISYRTFCRWEKETPVAGAKMEAGRMVYPETALEGFAEMHADDVHTAQARLLHETSKSQRESSNSAKSAYEAAAVALKSSVEMLGSSKEHAEKLFAAALQQVQHLSDALDKRDAMIGHVFEALQSFYDAEREQQRQQLQREREAFLSRERAETMFAGFRLALPGLIHMFAPSKATVTAGLATIFKVMKEEQRGRLMALVGELPVEAQATAGALLQEAIEQLEAEEKRKAEGPGVAKAQPREEQKAAS